MTAAADGSGSSRQEQHSVRLSWRKLFLNCTFRVRNDDFSVQVSCDQDARFWFRLEVAKEHDQITDFFLGSFDPALGGDLLAVCYKMVNRAPQNYIVFRDICASRPADAATTKRSRICLEEYAKQLLANYGRTMRGALIELRPKNKIDLFIET